MCAKCYALNNTCMGRYGAIMQALKAGTYDPEKKYVVDEEVCEEYKQRYINTEKIEEGLDL